MKRERTQLRQAIGVQQQQLETVVKMLIETQAELKKLKPVPSYTIETLPDTSETTAYTDASDSVISEDLLVEAHDILVDSPAS